MNARPRKRRRASAYAPTVPMAMASSVLDTETNTLLRYHATNSVLLTRCS
jgi:hypothetical protein